MPILWTDDENDPELVDEPPADWPILTVVGVVAMLVLAFLALCGWLMTMGARFL